MGLILRSTEKLCIIALEMEYLTVDAWPEILLFASSDLNARDAGREGLPRVSTA